MSTKVASASASVVKSSKGGPGGVVVGVRYCIAVEGYTTAAVDVYNHRKYPPVIRQGPSPVLYAALKLEPPVEKRCENREKTVFLPRVLYIRAVLPNLISGCEILYWS